jgi:hypothetical protein
VVLKPRIAVSGLAGVYVLRAMGLASLIALAVAVAPTSALAQFVCGGSATGAEVQTGGGATATGANATACGGAPIANAPLVTNASAFGAFANATGGATTAIGAFSLATATGATALGQGSHGTLDNATCVYRQLKCGRSGDEVRPGWRVN